MVSNKKCTMCYNQCSQFFQKLQQISKINNKFVCGPNKIQKFNKSKIQKYQFTVQIKNQQHTVHHNKKKHIFISLLLAT